MKLTERGAGKSWARSQLLKFAKEFGQPTGVIVREGLITEYYNVLGKRWAFVSPVETQQSAESES